MRCHSTRHAHHRDGADALVACYDACTVIREALERTHPELTVDFSFEAFGTDRPHIGALAASPLHHVTNLNTRRPTIYNARTIRQALYDYTTVLPNERILGSLIDLEGPQAVEHLLTALIAAPLVAGDLRQLSPRQRDDIRLITRAVRSITRDGPLTEFAKLHGDTSVREGEWDGYARWTPAGRGIVCLFRNGGDQTPLIRLPGLPPGPRYTLTDLLTGSVIGPYRTDSLATGITPVWPDSQSCRILQLDGVA